MLNIHDLEKRHKKYKINSMLPFIVLSTVVGATLIGATFFVLTYQKDEIATDEQQRNVQVASLDKNDSIQLSTELKKHEEKMEEKNETITQKPIEEKENTQGIQEIKKETEVQEETKRVVLTPSLEFISKIDTAAPKNYSSETISNKKKEVAVATEEVKPTLQEIKPIVIPQEIKEEKIEPIKIDKIETSSVNEEKKGSVSISRRDEQKDIADVIKRFNINHNPALSLFIAKKYYQLGDYEQAYNYALATNDINKNIEESWILFAKSLVKLNKKEMAVETLKKYISHSNSPQAKRLLEEINTGKFK